MSAQFPSLLQSAEDERRPLNAQREHEESGCTDYLQHNAESCPLSKWWRTDSAQNAIARAKQQRQERFAKVRAQCQAKQETIVRDVELWEGAQ